MGSTDVSSGDTILASQQNALRDDIIDQITTKGDLAVGTAADTMTRLGAGSDYQLLMALASEAAGVKWALKHKLNGITAPTANEDTGDGYEPGSVWIDTTNDKAYVCLDATLTAAVWTE